MPAQPVRLAFVIPTRNRAELAQRALDSVLSQLPDGSVIVVSDNSTQVQSRTTLQTYIEGLARGDVTYLRPPEDLAMPAHWDWALIQAESIRSITHATVLTDRMIFKRGALARLAALVAETPRSIISYNHDMVNDYSFPVRLECAAWSGIALKVTAARLLELSSALSYDTALPRMFNSIAPVEHIQQIRAAFGNVFNSIAPDYCFAYRTLSQVQSVRYIDEAFLVHGSLARSNAISYARGQASPDHVDFVARLAEGSVAPAAPVPGFETNANAMISEYELVRHQTGLARFVAVDMEAYFARIGLEISKIRDPVAASAMGALLEETRGGSGTALRSTMRARIGRLPSRRLGYLVSVLFAAVVSSWPTKTLWKRLGVSPPRTRWFRFQDSHEAFEFAQSPGRRASRTHPALRSFATRAAHDGDS